MGKEKQLLLERMFELVNSLTQKEKQHFRKFISRSFSSNSTRSQTPNYIQLYDKLDSISALNLSRLTSDLGLSEKAIHTAVLHLKKVLFESLAYYETSSNSGFCVAKKAMEKGFLKYSEQIILDEIENALPLENLTYLYDLYALLKVLDKFYEKAITLPFQFPSIEAFFKEYSAKIAFESFYSESRKMIRLPVSERLEAYQDLTTQLLDFPEPSFSKRCQLAQLKAVTIVNIVGMKNQEAVSSQDKVVAIAKEAPEIFEIESLVTEAELLIGYSIGIEEYESAKKHLFELVGMDTSSKVEKKLLKIWIVNSIFIAAITGDESLGIRGQRDLEENMGIFSAKWKGLLFHASSIFSFFHEKWDKVNFWQSKIGRLPKEAKADIEWIPAVLRTIALYEMGYIGEGKKLIKKIQLDEAIEANTYPIFVAQFLAAYGEALANDSSLIFLLESAKERLSHILNDPNIAYPSNFFNIGLWIESKRSGLPINVLASKDAAPSLMKLAFVS